MKLTMLGLQTSCLRAFVVILGFALVQTNVPAQEPSPFGENEKPLKSLAVPAKPAPAAPVADSKMPDISGMWYMVKNGNPSEAMIQRILDDEAYLVNEAGGWRCHVRWSRDTQCFEETTFNVVPKTTTKLIFQLLPDEQTMLVTISLDEHARKDYLSRRKISDSELDLRLKSEWTRKKMPRKTDAPTTSAVRSSSETSPVTVAQQPSAPKADPEQTPVTKPTKADAAISFTPAPVPASTGIPNTPAAKRLVEQLQAQESAAAADAATIRQLQANGQAEQNQPPIAEHQRKLKNLLSTAFDLKLQLEELQVKELQSRLSRLERQIGQRKELREKIIARRAGELIEGDTLKWDSTGAASRSAAETSSKSKPTNPTTKPVASAELTTQIHFSGPKGMEVSIGDKPEKLIAPARHTFLRHANDPQRYDIAFTKASDDPDRCFLALLDIFPITPETEGFLRHNAVPITITEQDAHHASGTLMIKAIYLPKPSSVQTAIPEIKSVAAWSISGDVIEAANQLGTILAVLRLSTNVDQLGKLEPRMSDAAITRPQSSTERNVTQQVTIDFPMANFPVIPGDRIEVQHLLHAEEGFHGPAKILASGLEVVGVARSLSTPTRTGLTLATTPEMAAMLEQSATTGLLFCHPLDPVVMLPCGRVVRIPLGIRQEGRLTVGDAVQVDRMSLAIGESNLAEPKFTGFATGQLIGFEHEDIPEGTTAPTNIMKLLLPKDSNIDAHVFQNRVDELIRDGTLFRGEMRERGDTTLFHTAVTEIEWQIESLEKRIAYYQAQVIDNAASAKAQLNLGLQRIRLGQLKAQRELYKTSADVMARVRPLKSEANSPTPGAAIPSPPIFRSLDE